MFGSWRKHSGKFRQYGAENGETSADAVVKSYKMSNNYGTEVTVITWGATIVSIKCLDKYGQPADIVLGFDNLDSYLDPRLSQMMQGCVVGRCAAAQQSAEGSEPECPDCVCPGACSGGFGRRPWEAFVEDECRVVMSYLSPDGQDGYPGALLTSVKFELTRSNSLEIAMRAVSSKPTTVNLSHGCIFNLAGHASGPDELRAHEVSLNCDRWIEQQQQLTSATALRRVGGTAMDLRAPRLLGQLIDELADEAARPRYMAIARGAAAAAGSQPTACCFASRILHRKTGRFLEVYSDQPGLDFCVGGPVPASADARPSSSGAGSEDACLNTAACVDEPPPTPELLAGKCGASYERFGGLSLLPRNLGPVASASVKPPLLLFPSATLRPGQVYYHDLRYKFGVDLDDYCLS